MNIIVNRNSMFLNQTRQMTNKNQLGNAVGNNQAGSNFTKKMSGLEAKNTLFNQSIQKEKKDARAKHTEFSPTRIIDESLDYAKSLSESRINKKNTDISKKKVKYNYKSISTQILRAKTSLSARQTVIKANRVVTSLKAQKNSGKYDSEEMDIAINHAKAMVRIAKKKANHLIQEELARASSGIRFGVQNDDEETIEKSNESYKCKENIEENESVKNEEKLKSHEKNLEQENSVYFDSDEYYELIEISIMEQKFKEDMSEDIKMFMDNIEETLDKMLEDTSFEDLQDSLMAGAGRRMSLEDYKTMKQKHRNSEMKAIIKADSEYLKAIFDKYSEETASVSKSCVDNTVNAGSINAGSINAGSVNVGSINIGFDVSI